LPFVIILIVIAAIVTAATVGGQAGPGSPPSEPSTAGVILVTFAPTGESPTRTGAGLDLAAATTIATSIAVAATSLPQSTSTGTPTSAAVALQPTATPAPSPRPAATQALTRQPTLAAALRTPDLSPIALPGTVNAEGSIIAVYTSYVTYTVRRGDTLNQVAADYGVSTDRIVRASHIQDPNLLQVGQVLTIPRDSGWLYRVQSIETLDQIAQRFGISVENLAMTNALSSPVIHAGDLLLIPN
jgi:LysM repeat protein